MCMLKNLNHEANIGCNFFSGRSDDRFALIPYQLDDTNISSATLATLQISLRASGRSTTLGTRRWKAFHSSLGPTARPGH